MKIAIISDVHCKWDKLVIPECDILISCGDYSFYGEQHIVREFHSWLDVQPAKHIISVQGNHEVWVEKNFNDAKLEAKAVCPRVHFVDEGMIKIGELKIWCSSWTPFFRNWAYNALRGDEIKRHWDVIPDDVNILVTHGPPSGILDITYWMGVPKERVGCVDLLNKILTLKQLKLHCFGHIHNESGETEINGVKFINAAICDKMYTPINPVRIFEYET